MLLWPCAIIQVVQQIGMDVDGSIVITIPATKASASSADAAADAPQWNHFTKLDLLIIIHLAYLLVCALWILLQFALAATAHLR